jgi:hypothetical protein
MATGRRETTARRAENHKTIREAQLTGQRFNSGQLE